MENLYELYLKRNIRRSVEWRQVFQNWIQQKSSIIEIYAHLSKIYDADYEFQERELRTWHMMLCAMGCTDITPYNKDISCVSIINAYSVLLILKKIVKLIILYIYRMSFGQMHLNLKKIVK